MPGSIPLRLIIALALGVWAMAAMAQAEIETLPQPRTYRIDWPMHGIRAAFEYGTQSVPQGKSVCAGRVSIENYGDRSYAVLFFSVVIYSESRERVATDRFSLSSNLKPGGRAEIPFDLRNPLNPAILTERYGECPRDMRWARVVLDAF